MSPRFLNRAICSLPFAKIAQFRPSPFSPFSRTGNVPSVPVGPSAPSPQPPEKELITNTCTCEHMCYNVLMAIRFIIEYEASITRPSWGGWSLCLQWGSLTDEEGKITEKGYRNIWRDENKWLFTGRAQARIPSKAMSDELWSIAEREGWAHLLGDGADQWQRVIISSSDAMCLAATARELMKNYSEAWIAAGFPDGAQVFSNNTGQDNATDRIYFFSPKATEIARDVLRKFRPEPCQQPDVGTLRKLKV